MTGNSRTRRAGHRLAPGFLAAALLATLAILTAPPAAAGTREAAEVFARGFGSKAAGLGNSFVSIADDASAVFWNPAGMGWMPRKILTFSLTDAYFSDVDYSSVSYVHPAGRIGALGVSLTRWNVGGIEKRDENNLLLDDGLSDTQMEIIASYSTRPLRNMTAGIGFKVDTQSMDEERAVGIGLDLGLLYRRTSLSGLGGGSLNAGINVRNWVEPVLTLRNDRTSFPTRVVLSTSYGRGRTGYLDGWTVTVDLNAPSTIGAGANFGLEGCIRPVSLRAGSSDGRFTAGMGMVWEGLCFDYAYSDEDYGRLHTFSLSIAFGGDDPYSASRARGDEEPLAKR